MSQIINPNSSPNISNVPTATGDLEPHAHGRIVASSFIPAWWLPGPHLQTFWACKVRTPAQINLLHERLELPDGDFIDLNWTPDERPNTPIVLVLHGLAGCVDSRYCLGALAAIQAHGWRGLFIHFRGASSEPNRLPRFYHSGDTGDLQQVLEMLHEREPNTPLAAIGFSLGGNVLLKHLGECGADTTLKAVAAISPPFDLHAGAARLSRGFSRVYQWNLLRHLKDRIRKKFTSMESPIPLHDLDDHRDFFAFDNAVTAPLHGFSGAADYHQQASCRQFLPLIRKPALIIHARNDPFSVLDAIPTVAELSPTVTLELSDCGGHLGFVAGKLPGSGRYWLDAHVLNYLDNFIN